MLFRDKHRRRPLSEPAPPLSADQRSSILPFSAIVEGLPEGIVVLQQGSVVYANAAALRMFGVPAAATLNVQQILDVLPPEYRSRIAESHPFRRSEFPGPVMRTEGRLIAAQGRMLDLEVHIRPIEWSDVPAMELRLHDVSDRKNLERDQALWHWEQEALREIDHQMVGVADIGKILDSTLRQAIILVRSQWAGVLRLSEGSEEASWWMVRSGSALIPERRFALEPACRTFLQHRGQAVLRDGVTEERAVVDCIPGLRDEGVATTVWSPLIVESQCVGALVVGYRHPVDVQARELRLMSSLAEKDSIAIMNARLYESVLARERELELLSAARGEAQEEERRRIAKQIHDGIGQMLTAIKFNLEILEDSVRVGSEDRERIAQMKTLLDDMMKEVQEMSHTLMPSVLDDFGLVPALQTLCEQFSRKVSVKAVFHNHGLTGRLTRSLEVALYRIAQEALSNVARHAAAADVTVQLIQGADRLRLVIEDNGCGISAEKRTGGLGFVSMRERASRFDGTLTVDSSLGRGTVVSVDIPMTGRGDR